MANKKISELPEKLTLADADEFTILDSADANLATKNKRISKTNAFGTAAALDVGTDALDVVQLDASARLPAVDGSQLTNLPGGGVSDHGALTGLTDDDHTGYARLAGRAGGQTLYGGTAASNTLTLAGSSNATSGTINASPSVTITGGAVTASAPALNITQTWNNAAVAFTGLQLDITNTASAASRVLDFKLGGASQLAVYTDGGVRLANGHCLLPISDWIIFDNAGGVNVGGGWSVGINGAGIVSVAPGGSFQWGAAYPIDNPGVALWMDASGSLAQRTTTNAQTYRLYNTWTDASNYERLSIGWSGNVCTIAPGAAGTGTLRGLNIGAAASLIGLFGVTPIVKPASAGQAVVTLGNADSEIGGLPISAAYNQAEVTALRDKCEELADDVRALSTLVHSLRTALVNLGAIKGAA